MEYLNAAGRVPLLTADEEILLGRAIQAAQQLMEDKPEGPYDRKERGVLHRGRKAKDRMVTANMRLVADVSKKYRRQCDHLSHEDLLQEGTFGLIRAAEKFDPERGYKFSTYAYWWIRQSMARAVATYDRTIRLPSHVSERIIKLRAWMSMRIEKHGYPTLDQCAEFLGVTREQARDYLQHMQCQVSLDAHVKGRDSEASTLIELIADSERDTPWDVVENDRIDQMRAIKEVLPQLPPSHQEVIQLRFFEGFFSQRQLGKRLGISPWVVGDIEQRAIRQIKVRMRCA
jgi:RNA polymerase primary sigma factor